MRIGFIGLGIMGRPMVRNLLSAGYEVVVKGNRPDVVHELEEAGATSATTEADVAAQVGVVITMVQDSPQVREAALGETGIVHGAHDGLVYVDCSSIAPATAQQVAAALAEKGVPMLDAPVSGGEPKAIEGTLSFMVGGDQEVFDRVRPVLAAMGASVVRVGPVGAGNVAKLANQVVVAVNIAAVSEALVLAQRAGVDPGAVYQAIRGGLAGSTVLDAKAPMMLERRFDPGFRVALHRKDLRNALTTSDQVAAPLPLTERVLAMMDDLAARGLDDSDHSALVQVYEQAAGDELGSQP